MSRLAELLKKLPANITCYEIVPETGKIKAAENAWDIVASISHPHTKQKAYDQLQSIGVYANQYKIYIKLDKLNEYLQAAKERAEANFSTTSTNGTTPA